MRSCRQGIAGAVLLLTETASAASEDQTTNTRTARLSPRLSSMPSTAPSMKVDPEAILIDNSSCPSTMKPSPTVEVHTRTYMRTDGYGS